MAQQPITYLQERTRGELPAPLPSERRFKWFTPPHGAGFVRIGGQYLLRKTVILVASESALILFALTVATVAHFAGFGEAQAYISNNQTWLRFALMVAVCQLVQWYSDMYDSQGMGSQRAQSTRVVRSIGVAMLVLALLYYFLPTLRLAGNIPVIAAPLSLLLILVWRFSYAEARAFRRPLESLLILGTGEPGVKLTQEILSRPELQYRVLGFLDADAENIGRPLAEPGIIGGISQLREIAARERVDRVIVSMAERRGVMPVRDLMALKVQGLPIEDAHAVYERITGRIMLEQLRPTWLILSEGFSKSRSLVVTKRALDIVASLALIILTAPLLLLTALAVVIESGKPIFFRQERVGLGGRIFQILKFRSMRQSSEESAPSWTADGDPRITRVGNFIRKYRLDELPQLFNVLLGEMSLIGPRPEVPYFCELLEREIPFFNQRHCVRPGISGWAQVKFKYGASLEEAKAKFEFDLFYIKHLSVLFDLTIILETMKVVLLGKGAK